VTGINALAPGAWHHLAYVFDGSIVALYADAVFDVSKSMIRVSANANTVQIGGDPAFGSGPQAFSDASLAEVAVYPLALTPTQIAAHYNARTTGARSRRVLGT
jgi:hypothetical protein